MSADDLINRYLDDRSALSAVELDQLIALLRAEPERAAALREQLVLDDLLAQKLAVDRRDFRAQVEQRIADFERGQDELDRQVSELRELAEAEIERPQTWSGSSPWVQYVVVLSAAALIAGLFLVNRFWPAAPVHVAKIAAVRGEVLVQQGGRSATAAAGAGLLSGQQLVVPAGGSLDIAYQDATLVRLAANTAATLDIDRATGAKQVRLYRGELTAQVQPQSIGMTFSTPHAVATVLGTQLRLQVRSDRTLLDVTEGQVRLDRLSGGNSQLVAAHHTGVATQTEFHVRPLVWPQEKKSLAWLFTPLELTEEDGLPLMAARNPASGLLRKTDLQPQGAASLLPSHHWRLDGGYLISAEAGPDLLAAYAGATEFTLEIVFRPADDSQKAARIVASADDGEPANFTLSQEGLELLFDLRTGQGEAQPLRIPLVAKDEPLSAAQQPRHVAITYQGSELVAYLQGAEILRQPAQRGPLANWREGPLTIGGSAYGENAWRGTVEALLLDRRCQSPAEIAQSAASYRLLAGREW